MKKGLSTRQCLFDKDRKMIAECETNPPSHRSPQADDARFL